MANEKDIALVDFLLAETDKGKVKWEPTARQDQFTASFKGKYNVVVDRSFTDNDRPYYWLKLTDSEDRELLTVSGYEYDRVGNLFDLARRRSLNVDAAIDEIMGGPRDEDIPF